MTDVARIGIAADSRGVVKATSDLDRLGDQAVTTEKQVVSAGRNATASMDDMGQSFNTAAASMRSIDGRGVAMQLSQVAQQSMATGNVVQALAIQLPDLAMYLGGPVAIGLGVAAGAALPLISNLIGVGDSAKDLSDDLDQLEGYLAALRDTAAGDVFSELEKSLRTTSETAKILLEISRIEAFNAVKNLSADLADANTEASIWRKMMLGTDVGLVGDLLEIETVLQGHVGIWKENRAEVQEFIDLVRGISTADDLDGMYQAAIRVREAFQEQVDVSKDMTAEQLEFWRQLNENIQRLELLGAAAEATADANRLIREEGEEILASLQQEAELQQLISTYGKDSAQVAQARLMAERGAYEEMLASKGIAGDLADEILRAWDNAEGLASVNMAVTLSAAADQAARLATNMQGAAAAWAAYREYKLIADMPPGMTPMPEGGGLDEFDLSIQGTSGLLPPQAQGWKPPRAGRTGRSGGGGKSEAEREAEKLHNDRLRDAESLLRDLETAQERYNRELADLNELYELGYINADEFSRAQEMLNEEMNADRFQSMSDGVAGFTDALFDNSTTIADWAQQALLEFAKVALQLQILQALGLPTAGLSLGGTFIGATLGFRAFGGPVSSGRPYVVGEQGPELMVPTSSGVVVPNHQMGGGATTVNQPITIDARGAQVGVAEQIAQAIERMRPQLQADAVAGVYSASKERRIG
ncbi:MAG: hypothetical protein GYB50_26790 [Rhodobacteraceae bacterium]|nr:hypothetical protein [Paracoccaceae bacterium]